MSAPRVFAALIFAIALALTGAAGTSLAQQMVPPTGAPIELGVNKGTLIRLDHNADTVFVADPEIADVKVKSPKLIYLFAKQPGETSLYAVDSQDHVLFNRPISVKRDVGRIQLALNQMLPNSSVDVEAVNGSLVLVGSVNSPLEAEEAKRIARPFVTDDKEIVNHITIDQPNQVNLRVRVAEVQRNIIKQLGINWDAIGRVGSFAFGLATGTPATTIPLMTTSGATTTTGNFITRNVGPSGVPTNSYLFGVNTPDVNVNSVIDALDQNGLVNILAEPNLTAMSGETASFLAGGEFPIVVPQNTNQVTVEFKPFGVALAFTPVVLESGRISLRVRPEVSQLSNTGAVQISGFTIPALSTRRAETTVELGSGQSFAIGGLLQNNITDTLNKVPGLGELPVLGALFRSDSFQRNESELVILVTPYLVKPVSDRRLQGPNSGYTPPNDVDRILRGRNVRPTEPVGGTAPTGDVDGNKLIGPAGFSLN
ncbi:MAG TPA: type II and III secretion system protein family protein [Alphaproteobacteria bacterium]|nr:type II and III secretion system protein family protein [Alphaproteobacteria bacterium]